MKKYFIVAKNTWDQAIVYRFNFVMWRFRNILQLITTYFLWFSIIPQGGKVLGYTQQYMLTYIIATAVVSAVVFSSLVGQVGEEINNGDLSNFLLRPINYFFYWFAKDTGDKAMNICFSVIEIIFFIAIFHPSLFLQTQVIYIVLCLFAILEGIFLHFFINFLLGCIGFWSSEIWAPRFIFFTVYNFFSGGLFPLDILPKPVFIILQLLPFPYLQYFPIKLYLGQVNSIQIISGLFIACMWILILYKVTQLVWKKGLIAYTAQGR